MDGNGGSSETADSHMEVPNLDTGPIKPTTRESDGTEADLNANINTHSELSQGETRDSMETDVSVKETTSGPDDGRPIETMDETTAPSEILDAECKESEVANEHPIHETCSVSEAGYPQPAEDIPIEIQNEIATENISQGDSTIMESQIVVQEDGIVENIEDTDGTPTVVVATEGEEGQYEIHMVSSEFRELAEGLPEGTQLMTEDGQLIHAVQEDEHGNMVVLANHQLTEIHTVDDQTGETVITETTDVVTSEVEDGSHQVHHVVSDEAPDEQVSFVQEEILEQQTEMVMLGEDAGYIVTEGESEELIVGEAPTLEVCAETEVGTTGSDIPGVYADENMLDNYVPDEGQVVVERIGYQPVQVSAIPQEVHHEEYFDDDDDEIGYQEDVVISESNHTIPNYDEASEIRMLTEAANNSLRSVEEHHSPPKKRRSRKKKMDSEHGIEENSKPKRRRRPQNMYFNELGEPSSDRTELLLKGLENLNLPIATAGTAPISPPSPTFEPQLLSPKVNRSTVAAPAVALQHPTRTGPTEIPRHLLHPRMAMPQKIPELSIPQMIPPQMVSPHMKSPNMGLPRMMSPSLVSPQMISPRMLSPGQQTSQLSPRTVSVTQKKHPLLSTMLSVTSPGGTALGPNISPPSGMVSPQNQMLRIPRNVVSAPGHFPFPPRAKVSEGQGRQQTQVLPNRPLPTPQTFASPQFPIQTPRQPISTPSTTQNHQTVRTVPSPHAMQHAQPVQSVPPGFSPGMMSSTVASGVNIRMPLQNFPKFPQITHGNPRFPQITHSHPRFPRIPDGLHRFPQAVSDVPSNQQVISSPAAPVRHAAVPPPVPVADHPLAHIPKSMAQPAPIIESAASAQLEVTSPNRPGREEIDAAKGSPVAASTEGIPTGPECTEPKPKIQELIKSELLAAAWKSRQHMTSVTLPEKNIEASDTLSATISRVEERLKLAAQAEAQKNKPEMALPSDKVLSSKYPETAQATNGRPHNPLEQAKLSTTAAQVQGSALPPISTLQTKLPPGLVPSTLSTSPAAEVSLPYVTSTMSKQLNSLPSTSMPGTVLESPPVTEAGTALPGQIPVPRGALRSPVSSSGLGKDPMLSDPTLAAQSIKATEANTDALKSPTHPLMTGRLPTPFPLAFAPGLPPVGLMMQPLPPLSFRPGMIPQARPSTELLRPGNIPAASSAGVTNIPTPPSVTSAPQLRSPTADKHKVLSSTLQSPPAGQPGPLDLIMEVMKKEMSANPHAFHHGQTNDVIRPGTLPQGLTKNESGGGTPSVNPRFPTPGPTMEMLMAIMQREVAAAQIQAQVAALHAAHAQAQVHAQSTGVSQKPASSTPQPVRPQMTVPQLAQLQAQVRPPPTSQTAVRPALPPVSTMMPNQIRPMNDVPSTVQSTTPQHARLQAPPVTTSLQNQLQNNSQNAPVQPPALQMNQQFTSKRSVDDTLADKYMKEWKPTGRFQCKFCYYSCVTQNFLFRHWVMNHCCMKPYLCAYCGLKSPTRDGITRHQTSKHKGNPRRVVIDSTQETTLIQNFKALFNLDVKEIHPEDIRLDNLEGIQFPEPYDPRLDKKSPGASNGETEMFSTMTELNHMVKNEQITPEKPSHGIVSSKPNVQPGNPNVMEPLPPHLREHFLAAPVTDSRPEENGGKTADYLKRHHKKSMIDAVGPNGSGNISAGPLSKEQLHALAVAQAAEIDRSMASVQGSKSVESQKLPSIADIRNDSRSSPVVGPNSFNTGLIVPNSTSNTLPSIRDLIQMPRGQILAMARLSGSQIPQNATVPVAHSVGQTFGQSQTLPSEVGTRFQSPSVPTSYNQGSGQFQGTAGPHDDRPVLPAGIVVPKLPQGRPSHAKVPSETEHLHSESEAHQAAAQLVSMANSRHPTPTRHMTPPVTNRMTEHDQQVAAMVSNVAAAAEQQKAALSIEHEVAAQLEDFARRKSGQSGKSPPAAVAPVQHIIPPPQNMLVPGVRAQKELTIDEQVALQLEEFRRRKAIIEAHEAMKPKKSPKAKHKRGLSQNMSHLEQRHVGSNSVNEVVAQLHQLAQKRADDQQQKLAQSTFSSPVTTAPGITQSNVMSTPQSTIDEQRLLAVQLEELAQKRAAAIQAAIKAQVQVPVTSPVVEREVATQLAEFADMQKQQSEGNRETTTTPSAPQPKDTMYHLYERAVVESYQSSPASGAVPVSNALVANHEQPVGIEHSSVLTSGHSTQQVDPSTSIYMNQQGNVALTPTTEAIHSAETTESGDSSKEQIIPEPVTSADFRQHSQTVASEFQRTQELANKMETSMVHGIDNDVEMRVSDPAGGENKLGLNVSSINGSCTQTIPVGQGEYPSHNPSGNEMKLTSDVTTAANSVEATSSGQMNVVVVDNSHSVKDSSQDIDHGVAPKQTESLGSNRVIEQETMCQESEMSDLSDRASISPGIIAATPETLQSTPERNAPPNEN